MKRQISVLDQSTIDKIAAGEVVERPSSVVKELVENAIDAGASAVTVEIKEGGISLIRITDNGAGIAKDQIRLAFLRHATSKISRVEDLLTITSLGFRGEALSSIAAVSRVELITKPHEELMGIRYVIEGGTERSMEEIGAPDGTTFLVRDLFYNTPARAKFLKSAMTEAGYISSFIEQLALSHPDISFKYIQNGQTKLHTSGNDNRKEVIYQIYGRDITRELVEVSRTDTEHKVKIEGYIAKPAVSRGNRNFENYYVNGRYVKSKIIMKAIEDAYHTFMMQHKYPFTSLEITLSGEDVDINVHPTKMEVRFAHQELIYRLIYQTIIEGLKEKELIPEVTLFSDREEKHKKDSLHSEKQPTQKKVSAPEPFEYRRKALEQPRAVRDEMLSEGYAVVQTGQSQQTDAVVQREQAQQADAVMQTEQHQKADVSVPEEKQGPDSDASMQPQQLELFDGKLLSPEAKKHHRIIGQVFDTYWIVQVEDRMYIIDQHAAHEKVLYERIVKEMKNHQVTSQLLSPPLIISLNLQEQEQMQKYQHFFAEMGFEVEAFGGKEYSIRAVPQNLYGFTGEEFFLDLLDHMEEIPSNALLEVISDRMATMACKAAIKGNHRYSYREAEALIDELLLLENPYNCPHGRPTIISMTKYELEKKFKRIV